MPEFIPISLVELSQLPIYRFGSEQHRQTRDWAGRFYWTGYYILNHGHFLTLERAEWGQTHARWWPL